MKKIITTTLLFFFVIIAKTQTISPSADNEYCPNVIVEFTVNLPGEYSGISASGGFLITQNPNSFNSTKTNFKFKGTFNDANQAQSVAFDYKDNGNKTYTAVFKKIKSLLFANANPTSSCGIIHPTNTSITATKCQISNINISFTKLQWYTAFENPTFCFGTIDDYEYKLPANWQIGSSVSTGNNWIQGSSNVTVTTDLTTGDGSTIFVRPKNTCGTNMANTSIPGQIVVSRPNPSLSLSPSPSSVNCGSTPPVTFTVNGTASLSGITGYVWSLGSSNGWTYQGITPAPSTITTTSNSIVLTPSSANSAPTAVGVSVSFTGGCQVNVSNNIQYIIPGGNYGLLGNDVPCRNTISTYTLQQTPPSGTTVTWSINPNDGSINISPNGNSVDVDASNANSNSFYTLSATVTGNCYYATGTKQFNVPTATWTGQIYGLQGWYNTLYGAALAEGDNYLYTGTGANYFEIWNEGNSEQANSAYWEHVSGDYASYTGGGHFIGFDLWWLPTVDAYYNYHFIDYCGNHSIPYHFISTSASPPSFRMQQPPTKELYKLSITPNPVNTIAYLQVEEITGNKTVASKQFDYTKPVSIRIYDKLGTVVLQQYAVIPKTGLKLNIAMLRQTDVYNIVIEDGKGIRLSTKMLKR